MKTVNLRYVLRRAAATAGLLAALLKPRSAAAATFAPVEMGAAGLVGDGIALFVPTGIDPSHLPYTPALIAAPTITSALPTGWRDAPVFSSDGKKFRATVAVAKDDDLYGGGEVTGPLRRNGTTIELWNTDNLRYETAGGRRLYQSHPWVLGVRRDGSAYGVLFDSTWKAELKCGDAIAFTSEGPAFPVLVIERASPQAVVSALAELTGKMPLPPR